MNTSVNGVTFSAVNQGGKMVKVVDVVVWPKAGAVNKIDKRK